MLSTVGVTYLDSVAEAMVECIPVGSHHQSRKHRLQFHACVGPVLLGRVGPLLLGVRWCCARVAVEGCVQPRFAGAGVVMCARSVFQEHGLGRGQAENSGVRNRNKKRGVQ